MYNKCVAPTNNNHAAVKQNTVNIPAGQVLGTEVEARGMAGAASARLGVLRVQGLARLPHPPQPLDAAVAATSAAADSPLQEINPIWLLVTTVHNYWLVILFGVSSWLSC